MSPCLVKNYSRSLVAYQIFPRLGVEKRCTKATQRSDHLVGHKVTEVDEHHRHTEMCDFPDPDKAVLHLVVRVARYSPEQSRRGGEFRLRLFYRCLYCVVSLVASRLITFLPRDQLSPRLFLEQLLVMRLRLYKQQPTTSFNCAVPRYFPVNSCALPVRHLRATSSRVPCISPLREASLPCAALSRSCLLIRLSSSNPCTISCPHLTSTSQSYAHIFLSCRS